MKTFLHISSKYGRGGVGNAVKRMHFNLIDNNHNSIIINDVNDDKKNNIYKINNILNFLIKNIFIIIIIIIFLFPQIKFIKL